MNNLSSIKKKCLKIKISKLGENVPPCVRMIFLNEFFEKKVKKKFFVRHEKKIEKSEKKIFFCAPRKKMKNFLIDGFFFVWLYVRTCIYVFEMCIKNG